MTPSGPITADGATRVVLVDFDVVCSLGIGRDAVWSSLVADVLPAAKVTRFDASKLPVDAAAEVHEPLEELVRPWGEDALEAASFDRKLELLLAAASLAAERFDAALEGLAPDRRGVVLGVGLDVSPVEKISKALLEFEEEAADAASLERLNRLGTGLGRIFNPSDLAALLLAHRFGCGAFHDSVLTACSSSSQAIGVGFDAIRRGEADAVLVGGTDSLLNLPAFSAFSKLGVIQPGKEGPASSCKPGDRGRRGTLLGEGAGLLLLTSAAYAEARGLGHTVELLGYGNTLDGYHITSPDPTGRGMRRAMEVALERSGVAPDELDYVNLHGTGTRANDPAELDALASVLGEAAPRVAVSSTKDRHGHLIAAAGVMEAIVVHLCMTGGLAPRTVNLTRPIDTEVDLVMGENRSSPMEVCMSNSFAFGGINTSLVFRRVGG